MRILALTLIIASSASAFLQLNRLASKTCRGPSSTTLRMASGEAGWALLFDCDGVLADTERDGHRPAFNEAFKQKGIKDCIWDVELYGELLKVGGGKERMTAHWNKVGWPQGYEGEDVRKKLAQELHLVKTQLFMDTIQAGKVPLRPGVLRIVDEAIKAGVPLGVCSTSNDKAVRTLVEVLMGEERATKFQIFAGDVVPKKKPSPDIYLLAKDTMGLDPKRTVVDEDSETGLKAALAAVMKTVVIEDSEIGLKAALAAGMKCIVTKSSYTKEEDFKGANLVIDELGDGAGELSFADVQKLALQ